MIFEPTVIADVVEIKLEPRSDERGFFARTWCQKEFEMHGLNPNVVQCNISFNRQKGTLRGMHYQTKPCREAKLVRCTRGAIYDVAIDLRKDSSSYKKWISVELTSEKRNMLYIPEGCAHGFLTLEHDTEVFYQMSEFYLPDAGRGVRWNDPEFQISWPGTVEVISERDQTYPDFSL